ncbi:MAG: hypothetical protein VX701_05735 [Chloroflexota bacterium]|nr:hypothetical protein [Chloroflexota bacterium]
MMIKYLSMKISNPHLKHGLTILLGNDSVRENTSMESLMAYQAKVNVEIIYCVP